MVVDSGHNPSALEALVVSLGAFKGTRSTVVPPATGDRSDKVIIRQAEILAPHFERVILETETKRGLPSVIVPWDCDEEHRKQVERSQHDRSSCSLTSGRGSVGRRSNPRHPLVGKG